MARSKFEASIWTMVASMYKFESPLFIDPKKVWSVVKGTRETSISIDEDTIPLRGAPTIVTMKVGALFLFETPEL